MDNEHDKPDVPSAPDLVPTEENEEDDELGNADDFLASIRASDNYNYRPPVLGGPQQPSTTTAQPPQQRPPAQEDPNNGWDDRVQTIVLSFANKAYKARELHDLASTRAKRRNTIFNFTLAGITAISGVFGYIPTATENQWLKLIGGVIAQLATTLAVINAFLDFGGDAVKHRTAEANFRALLARLQQQLLQPDPKVRINGNLFLQSSLDALTKVANKSPPLPKKLRQQYTRKETSQESLAQGDTELRDITIGVNLRDIPRLERVNVNGRESYRIEIDPIDEDLLQNIFGINAL